MEQIIVQIKEFTSLGLTFSLPPGKLPTVTSILDGTQCKEYVLVHDELLEIDGVNSKTKEDNHKKFERIITEKLNARDPFNLVFLRRKSNAPLICLPANSGNEATKGK